MSDEWEGLTPWEFDSTGAVDWGDPGGGDQTSVSVPLFALAQPPAQKRPRRPILPRLSWRTRLIGAVCLVLAVAVIVTVAVWPRPPKLTDREFVAMLAAPGPFQDVFLPNQDGTYDPASLATLPDEDLSAALAETAGWLGLNALSTEPGCDAAALTDGLSAAKAMVTLSIAAGTEDPALASEDPHPAIMLLVDTPARAKAFARPFLVCYTAAIANQTTYATNGEVTSEKAQTEPPSPLTLDGMTAWRSPIRIPQTDPYSDQHWMDEYQLTMVAYGNTVTLFMDPASAGLDQAMPAFKAAIDAAG